MSTERAIVSDHWVTIEMGPKDVTATCDGYPDVVEKGKDRDKVIAAIQPRIEAAHNDYVAKVKAREKGA